MRAPPGLVAAALLFWGRQSGFLAAAVPLAALLEGALYSPRRWDLSRRQFHRVSDLCTLLFFGGAVILYTTREPLDALRASVLCMPVTLLPLILAQNFSVQRAVDASVFYWSYRERQAEDGPRRAVSVDHAYAAACVFAASAANRRDGEYLVGLLALAAWALWGVRRPGAPAALWAALLVAAGAVGMAAQARLPSLQGFVENAGTELAYRLAVSGKSPFEVRTALGAIGSVKGSGLIVLRVEPAPGEPPPALLRNAAYHDYRDGTWSAHGAAFKSAEAASPGAWTLSEAPAAGRRVRLSALCPAGRCLLALPSGTFGLSGLGGQIEVNRLGSARADQVTDPAVFEAAFSAHRTGEASPGPADMEVPRALRGPLSALAAELRLDASRPAEAVATVRRHFDAGFAYSVYRSAPARGDPVVEFLFETKRGHCEYFATAAVLLLRAAGVPARYATGFAVDEYSRLERAFVVRQRHAHAWAQVWADGRWRDLDVTPPVWSQVEAARAPMWQPLRDALSWARERIRRELRGGASEFLRRRGVWVLLPLLTFLAWRIAADLRGARLRRRVPATPPAPGSDSEFLEIERRLAAQGVGRRPWETIDAWLERLAALPGRAEAAGALRPLAALHERYRFDPRGLNAAERLLLAEGCLRADTRPAA